MKKVDTKDRVIWYYWSFLYKIKTEGWLGSRGLSTEKLISYNYNVYYILT